MTAPLLTKRQREVVELTIKHGYAKLVACELGITQRSVDEHLSNCRKKFNVRTTPQLTAAFVLVERAP